MRVLALVALVLVAASLVPLAAADHVYSHRLVVYGRVEDAQHHPLEGVNLSVARTVDYDSTSACTDQPGTSTQAFGKTEMRLTTDASGFFVLCQHVHAVDRTQGAHLLLRVTDALLNVPVSIDPETRVANLTITLATPVGRANLTQGDYVVAGRAWRPTVARVAVEAIPVYGETVNAAPVAVMLGGKTYATQTNGYGDFALRVPVDAWPASGDVTVQIGNQTWRAPVNATGWTFVEARWPLVTPPVLFTLQAKGNGAGCWWVASGSDEPNPELDVPPGADVNVILKAGATPTDAIFNASGVALGGFRAKAPMGSDLLVNFTAPLNATTSYVCTPNPGAPVGIVRVVEGAPRVGGTIPAPGSEKPSSLPLWVPALAVAAALILRRR